MNTYHIASGSFALMNQLAENPKVKDSLRDGYRLILLTDKALTKKELSGVNVIFKAPRDEFEHAKTWVKSNPVDELHGEFLTKRSTPLQRERALDDWDETRQEVALLEKELEQAKARLEKAARKLVKVFGKSPISIDGQIYDPSYSKEHVFYQKRMGG